MLKNVYTSLSGGLSQQKLLDIIANNLANANTSGFKEEKITFSLLESEPYDYKNPIPPANFKTDFTKFFPLRGNDQSYVGISEVKRSELQGPAIGTQNPLDFMIEGEGYFGVQTNEGLRYTRSGDFTLSNSGILVSSKGDPIVGENGAITLRNSAFTLEANGEIYQDGELVDKLKITKFENEGTLEKVGSNYYFYSGDPKEVTQNFSPKISQGYLEGSNVNIIQNLTAMISAHRSFESYQKSIKNFDQMMEKSANSIGEIRV